MQDINLYYFNELPRDIKTKIIRDFRIRSGDNNKIIDAKVLELFGDNNILYTNTGLRIN